MSRQYITEAEYKTILGEKSFESYIQNSRSTADATARFNFLCQAASGIIDAHLYGKYHEDIIDENLSMIKYICAWLVQYKAIETGKITELQQSQYSQMIDTLKQLREGTINAVDQSDGTLVDDFIPTRAHTKGRSPGMSKLLKDIEKW